MSTQIAAIVLGELALLGLVIVVVAVRMQERARWRMDLQTRLLDRFTSPAELQQFLESDGGKSLLRTLSPRPSAAPRMLLAVQAGVVFLALGSGLVIIGDSGHELDVLGGAVAALGLGLLASALVSWVLARRWGLLPDAHSRADQ